MPGHFKKKDKKRPDIPTASMPDIIFILLCFFMVTTVLRDTSVQVRIKLPQAEALTKIDQKRLITYVYVGPKKLDGNKIGETGIQIDDALVDVVTNVRAIMYAKLVEQPKLIVSLRVDEISEMGIVLDVQQELREAGTLRINYSTKRLVVL